jgi:hypothetical protein
LSFGDILFPLKSISKICLDIFVREDEKFEKQVPYLGGFKKTLCKGKRINLAQKLVEFCIYYFQTTSKNASC